MAEKQPPEGTRRYRVIKDFKGLDGTEHHVDDEIDLSPVEGQAHVNAGKVTAELKSGDK